MREYRIDGEKTGLNIRVGAEATENEDLVSPIVEKYYDIEIDDIVVNEVPVAKYSYKGDDFLVARNEGDEIPKNFEVVLDVVKDVVDIFSRIMVVEFKKCQFDASENEMAQNLIAAKDILGRIIFNFSQKDSSCIGQYEVVLHRLRINCYKFFDAEGKFFVKKFIKTLVHEMLHFVSYGRIDYVRATKKLEINGSTSGYVQTFGPNQSQNKFNQFNEAVISLYEDEISRQIMGSMGLDISDDRFKQEDGEEKTYQGEINKFKFVVKYLSEYVGVSYNTLWSAFKRGVLEGQHFDQQEIVEVLEECFGEGFIDNYLGHFMEKDPKYKPNIRKLDNLKSEDITYAIHFGTIDERWKENGKKRLTGELVTDQKENIIKRLKRLLGI